MQTTDNLIEAVPKPDTSPDRLHIPSKRELSTSDDGTLFSPFDIKKISLADERFTAEQPTLFPNLLRSVPPSSFPTQRPTQLPTLQTDQNTSTGATDFSYPSRKSNKFSYSSAEVIACTGNFPLPPEVIHFTQKNTATSNPPTVTSDGNEDEDMNSTTSLTPRVDGEDASNAKLQEEEVQATSSTAPTAQGSSTRQMPLPRDTSFSTRPSRKAARNAAAVMAATRKKAKRGRGKGGGDGGGAGGSAPPPPPTGSAPPPPPPPARRSRGGGGNGPPSGGHNVTWGFTTGPGGPWIEPPVVKDNMFARPSEKKGLRKETKEAIKQSEWAEPNYDPHSPSKVRKQETMYNIRLLANSSHQWPTSNVRGAVDWEEVQKRRMGVAVREAMRQQEEEDEAEEMEKLRKMRLKQKADKKRDNGEGSSQSAAAGQLMNTNRDGDGAGSFTTMAGSDADYVDEEKSGDDDDDAATLVGQQSDDDDGDHAVHRASLETIPRSFNDDFAQRLAALRKTQRTNRRVPSSTRPTAADDDGGASGYIDPYASDQSRRYRSDRQEQLNLNQAYEQDEPSLSRSNNASSPAALRKVASEMINDMYNIASRDDNTTTRTTGDGGPARMHDFEYNNLVASGQIGGAADTREARPAPGPFVFRGSGSSNNSNDAVNNHNARITDLMDRHLDLQLESPPPPGEPFPALTGEWPQFPAGLMGQTTGLSDNSRVYGGGGGTGGAGGAARRGFGRFGGGSSGSGQQRPSRRPE